MTSSELSNSRVCWQRYWLFLIWPFFALLFSCNKSDLEQSSKLEPVTRTQPWHLFGPHGINIGPAWEITTGSKDVTIAVLDKGFLPQSPAFSKGQCLASTQYFDFFKTKNTVIHEHGAWVSSLISTCENNPLGLIGINKNSRLLWLEMTLEPAKKMENLSPAFWALGEKGVIPCTADNKYPAQVLNLSFSIELKDFFDKAQYLVLSGSANKLGSIVVVSAGNDAKNADSNFPSATTGTIAVGATTESGVAWSQSNWGESMAIMAPGTNLWVPTKSAKGIVNGTSFSTAIISGVISLMRSVYPELNWKTALYFLQSTAVKMDCSSYCVAGRSIDAQNKCKQDCCVGEEQICTPGRVDAGRAVAQAKYAAEHGLPLVSLVDADEYLVILDNKKGRFRLFNVGGASGKYKLSFPDGGLVFSNNKKTLEVELKAKGQLGDAVEIEIGSTKDFVDEARIRIASPQSGVTSNFSDELVIYAI